MRKKLIPLLGAFLVLLVGNYGVQHVKDIMALVSSGVHSVSASPKMVTVPEDADRLVQDAVDDLVHYSQSREQFGNIIDKMSACSLNVQGEENEYIPNKRKCYLELKFLYKYVPGIYGDSILVNAKDPVSDKMSVETKGTIDTLEYLHEVGDEVTWADAEGVDRVNALFLQRTRWIP